MTCGSDIPLTWISTSDCPALDILIVPTLRSRSKKLWLIWTLRTCECSTSLVLRDNKPRRKIVRLLVTVKQVPRLKIHLYNTQPYAIGIGNKQIHLTKPSIESKSEAFGIVNTAIKDNTGIMATASENLSKRRFCSASRDLEHPPGSQLQVYKGLLGVPVRSPEDEKRAANLSDWKAKFYGQFGNVRVKVQMRKTLFAWLFPLWSTLKAVTASLRDIQVWHVWQNVCGRISPEFLNIVKIANLFEKVWSSRDSLFLRA